MNILIVCYEYPPLGGGGGVAVHDIAHDLAHRHRVHVLTSSGPNLKREETVEGLDLTIFRSRVLFRSARAVASIPSMLCFYPFGIQRGRRLIREYTYDVVNSWFAIPSGPTGTHLASIARVPNVLTLIGGDLYDPSKWYSPHRNPLLKRTVTGVLRKAHAHLAISKDVADRTRDIYGFDRPVEVVSLGIDLPNFAPATRKELGLHRDVVYLATVGRLVHRKDHETLLRALAQLNDPKVHLLVIGDGPLHDPLGQLASQLNIAKQVQFCGFVPEQMKFQLLSNADLFSLTSLHEGFGLAYLEAMHCGLPIVATTTGGQKDFLEDGKTGYLVPTGNADAIKQALSQLVAEPRLRQTMGAYNRQLASQYTVARTAQRYESAFERAAVAFGSPAAERTGI